MEAETRTSYLPNPPVYRSIETEIDLECHRISHESSPRGNEAGIEVESPNPPNLDEPLPPVYEPPVFTTDGANITFLNSDAPNPQHKRPSTILDGTPSPPSASARARLAAPQGRASTPAGPVHAHGPERHRAPSPSTRSACEATATSTSTANPPPPAAPGP